MAIVPGGRAPYAEPGNIRRVIHAYRKGELPTPLSPELLMRARVGANAVAETLESLKLLGLVDEDGQPTPAFETLRSASESEFQMRLGEVVRVAYDDLFRSVDPIKDSPAKV
jgi:hypothetical protein